jgi:hypothetical protein
MKTIKELISQNIKTTLESISTANGYDNDYKNVQMYNQGKNTFNDLPCIIFSSDFEEKQEKPLGLFTCDLSVGVGVWFIHDYIEYPVDTTESILNSFQGDLEKALMVDRTRGGLAVNTNIRSLDRLEMGDDDDFTGVIIYLEINYRHSVTNPKSLT